MLERDLRAELIERIEKWQPTDGLSDPIEGLRLARSSRPTERIQGTTLLALCIIAQGAKEVTVGERRYRYDSDHYLLTTVELPLTGCVVEAVADRPYLSLALELDPNLVGSVMVEAGLTAPPPSDGKAVVVSRLDAELLDAVVRLVRLLDSPEKARVLLPLVKREIIFRLLVGEQGGRLRHLPGQGAHSRRIAQAVERLRRDYDQPLRIEHLARDLGMSSSGFYQHFKAVTDMSPLQFQKQIRLQEARRLMLEESMDASGAGYRVGYEDASHFSRDYKRYFGDSPLRDAERLRGMATAD